MSFSTFQPIAPRVLSSLGEKVLLTDLVDTLLFRYPRRTIQLFGPGARTALSVLRDAFCERLHADSSRDGVLCLVDSKHELVLQTFQTGADERLQLASWQLDEFIEYALANHKDQAKSVITRAAEMDSSFADGSPVVWRLILDVAAADPAILRPEQATLKLVDSRLPERQTNAFADQIIKQSGHFDSESKLFAEWDIQSQQLLENRDVRNLVIARRISERLRKRDRRPLQPWIQRGVLGFLVEFIREELHSETQSKILRFLKVDCFERRKCAGIAASILHVVDATWRPDGACMDLSQAELQGAEWQSVNLPKALASLSNLDGAELQQANLQDASFFGSSCRDSNLHRANLRGANFQHSKMSAARLTHVSGVGCDFGRSVLQRAKLANSIFDKANFTSADLTDGNLFQTSFKLGRFDRAVLRNTSIRECNFSYAVCNDVDFRNSALAKVDFTRAHLENCNFEGQLLDGCNFTKTTLSRTLLSDTSAKNVSFYQADLRAAGMAMVNWEDCDLRGADFTNVAFFLGSTRCGLVDSPYPSHGTRTGFYTDDYDDLYYQQPELVRKASLVGCDLRGAKLKGTDFYLVDLRGAKIDAGAMPHLVACGAILD